MRNHQKGKRRFIFFGALSTTTTTTTTPTTTTSTTEVSTDCDTVPVEWHGSTNSAVLYKSTSSRIVKVKIPTSDDYPTDIDSLYTGWIIFTKVCFQIKFSHWSRPSSNHNFRKIVEIISWTQSAQAPSPSIYSTSRHNTLLMVFITEALMTHQPIQQYFNGLKLKTVSQSRDD